NPEIALSSIAKIFTINRCVNPESKSAVAKWFEKTSLPQLLDIDATKVNKSRLFRDLSGIEENKDNICNHLLAEYTQRFPDKLNEVYYDLSSTTFSGTKCIISKYGHCKEGYQTHVVLALLVTEDGLPFYWEVLPGGTADAKTIQWLLDKCKKKFTDLNITAVFDRGFVSDDNLKEIESDGIKYITAMDRNQIEGICAELVTFTQFSDFTSENIVEKIKEQEEFTEINSNTYYREIKVEDNRRYVLCFNPQLFTDQRNARDKNIELLNNDIIPELNDELKSARKSRQRAATESKFKKYITKLRLSSFSSIKLDEITVKHEGVDVKTFQGKLNIDDTAKKESVKLDGFWMLVTNLSEKNSEQKFIVSSEKALRPYRDKVIIEDAFRDIKSFLEVAPVYVWLEKHVKSHYTICVLAYLINRTISNLLKESEASLSGDIKTHMSVYKELANGSVDEIYIKNLDQSSYCLTELTKKQKEILQRLGAGGLSRVNDLLKSFGNKVNICKN
ncbi:MAG: IS1634 family transposase, partial [Bacteroidota bacterium]|nr:IS1634 family transposase [Bacteroidota bacterium]